VSVLLQVTTVALSDPSLKFPLQLVGNSSAPQPLTLTNSGPITLIILSITASEISFRKTIPTQAYRQGELHDQGRLSAQRDRNSDRQLTITDDAPDSDGGGGTQDVKLRGTGIL
jgi:hypothetical protein